ncbi:MAG TPA: hypothetical protein VH599_12120 [Ktedonobacterales bacterium]|jgi:hypothetical protein
MKALCGHAHEPEAALWFLLLLGLGSRVVVALLTAGADFDITSYHIQAQSVLAHRNVYTVTDRYPYPPVWIWLVALAQWTTTMTGLPFVWLVKLPGILGDGLIVALLYRAKGRRAALFYALNPVSILITAGHGQFDGLVMALVVVTWVLWNTRQDQGRLWAALALGGAIALKGYPVLLLPALLLGAASGKQRGAIIGLALTPLLACVLVYTVCFGLQPAMITHVLGYQSPPMLGWSLYLHSPLPSIWPSQLTPGLLLLALFLPPITRVMILCLPVALALRQATWTLENLWLATLLGFYSLAPGLSPQYLLWSIPLLALMDLKQGILWSGFATPTLVFLYLANFPGAVPGGLALVEATPISLWVLGYRATNLAWWLSCLWLWHVLFRQGAKPSTRSKRHRSTPREVPVLYGSP